MDKNSKKIYVTPSVEEVCVDGSIRVMLASFDGNESGLETRPGGRPGRGGNRSAELGEAQDPMSDTAF